MQHAFSSINSQSGCYPGPGFNIQESLGIERFYSARVGGKGTIPETDVKNLLRTMSKCSSWNSFCIRQNAKSSALHRKCSGHLEKDTSGRTEIGSSSQSASCYEGKNAPVSLQVPSSKNIGWYGMTHVSWSELSHICAI